MKLYGPLGDHFNGPGLVGETNPFSIMLTSRGCPGQCIFCFKKMYQDKKTFRSRSPKNVADEIELLVKKHHVRAIYFQDLSFCIDQKRVVEICREIGQRGLKFSWGCEARFDTIGPEMLAAMKKAGSNDPVKVAHTLEGMKMQTALGEVEMRADNHQLLQPLYISTMSDKAKYDVEHTGLGFVTNGKVEAKDTALPTTCQIERPN